MVEFFMSGGIAMYPTLLFGFLLVACSILFLFRPEPRYLASLVGLGAPTGSARVLRSPGLPCHRTRRCTKPYRAVT